MDQRTFMQSGPKVLAPAAATETLLFA